MTKYILNSGGVGTHRQKAEKFFQEIVSNLGNHPKVLLCLFAIPRESWEDTYLSDMPKLASYFPNAIQPEFTLALPDRFVEQVQKNDAIYIYGGDDMLVQYWLRKFDIPHIWDQKVVATNSASSNALAAYFWTCDWRKIFDGLGILSIKFLPHYQSSYGATDPRGPIDWKKAKESLAAYKDTTLPLYALEEGDYVVINN